MTGGALLERWDVFPKLIEPIRSHHQIGADTPPETALIALANCLAKGLYPFPRSIRIPEEFQESYPDSASKEAATKNPLISSFGDLLRTFEEGKENVSISPQQLETGEFEEETIEAIINTAKEAAYQEGERHILSLEDQNPEFSAVLQRLDTGPEDMLALMLLSKDVIADLVNGLVQSTATRA